MQVIGAGFGRTGTNSLRMALNQLGYKTYHMEEAFPNGHIREWAKLYRPEGGTDPVAAEAVLDLVADAGYNASLDFPICSVYKEQLKRNPKALVILSLRSDAATWAESFVDTIGRPEFTEASGKFPMSYILPGAIHTNRWMFERVGFKDVMKITKEEAAKVYEDWAAEVKASVPKEQLLVHQSKDGWPPLCKALGIADKDCPSARGEPYPRAPNDRAAMLRMFRTIKFIVDYFPLVLAGVVVVVAGFVWGVWRCCCARRAREKGE
mmetsp:Transcript_35933/g.82129  ORF Transcript_35933/g.82129 Transcript_35933/m.82129 type:complete len:265 (+) Transcript_35933:103-897(+)